MAFAGTTAAGAINPSLTVSSRAHPLPAKKLSSFKKLVPLIPKCDSPQLARFASIPPSPFPAPTVAAPPSFDLRTYWTSLIATIDADLDAAIPVRYPVLIHDAMRYLALSPGAKRAPPVLCLATACDLLGAPPAAALPTACALEMAHAASLAHDDLPCMDAAPTRRGRPSAHAAFGPSTAILAGDALLPYGILHIIERTPRDSVPETSVLRVVAEITQAVGSTGMAAGQFLDLDESGKEKDVDTVTILQKKFGCMAECSALCGGLIGGADDEVLEQLRRYGRAVGVLYEVVDDILMAGFGGNGSEAKMRNRNASIVGVYGMERALEIADDLQKKATVEVQALAERYGEEKTLPLQNFVEYAAGRGFVISGGHGDGGSDQRSADFSSSDNESF